MEKIEEKQAPVQEGPAEGLSQEEQITQLSLPNSMIMRIMELPAAEAEADRLSAGVNASAPADLRREMGSRLGADLSGARFHTGSESLLSNESMNARAWTSGRDIYFGKGGFEPRIAAHELVHTVQQGAFRGSVEQHVPTGSVQLWPWSKKTNNNQVPINMDQYDKIDFFLKMEAGLTMDQMNQAKGGGKKNVISANEQSDYDARLKSITYDDYNELMKRMEDDAVKMSDYRDSLFDIEEKGPNDFKTMNQAAGRNYRLYHSILTKIEGGIPANTIKAWKERRSKEVGTNAERADKIRNAAQINERMSNRDNYEAAAGNDEALDTADQETANYYENVFKGKDAVKNMSKIDKLAEIYGAVVAREKAERKKAKRQSGKVRQEPEIINKKEKIIEEDAESDQKSDAGKLIDNLMGMKEKDASGEVGSEGMKENNDILQANSLKTGSFGGKDIISESDGSSESLDPVSGVRRAGAVNEALADEILATNGKTKKGNTEAGLAKNIANLSNDATQLGMAAHYMEDFPKVSNAFTNGIYPGIKGGAGLLGSAVGGVGVVTGIQDARRNVKNLKNGGSKWDVATSVLDTASSVGAVGSGLLTAADAGKNLPGIGNALGQVSGAAGGALLPGFNILTGGTTAVSGAIQGIRGWRSVNKIDKEIKKLKDINEEDRTKDQRKMLKTFRQSRRVAEYHRASGGLKALSGGITAGAGIATLLTGPLAPLTGAIVGVVGALTGIGKFVYDKVKKYYLRKDVTAEAMKIDWDTEMKRVRRMFPNEKLKDKEVRAIILKGHGFKEGTRTAAFKQINQKRANHLLKMSRKEGEEGEMARNIINALGVHRGKNKQYADGAALLLAEKLGAG